MELLSDTRRWSDNEYLGRLAGRYDSSYLVKTTERISKSPLIQPILIYQETLSCIQAFLQNRLSRRVNFLGYDLLELKGAELIFPEAIRRLATSLIVRCSLLRRIEDLYQIYLGQLENAIEICEQGRALLWSEMPACPIDEV